MVTLRLVPALPEAAGSTEVLDRPRQPRAVCARPIPAQVRRRSAASSRVPATPATSPRPATAVPRPAPARPPVRLTRRGRALIRSVILLMVALAAFAVTVTTRADDVTPVASRSIVVAENDTLWTIATRVAPGQPRSVTMEKIRELNGMPDSTVRVGQRLLIPAAPSHGSAAR